MLASQVIMCPKSAADKIPNLLISVSQHGCTTGDTLHSAYKELSDAVITPRKQPGKEDESDVIIADGHKSRFDLQVLNLCRDSVLEQFILWPDTSGATQKHDQINAQLHAKYETAKSTMFSPYSDINRECFMNILAEVINEWGTPEQLVKAGKKVGITSTGLSIKYMDQKMDELTEKITRLLDPESQSDPSTHQAPTNPPTDQAPTNPPTDQAPTNPTQPIGA